MVDLTGFDASKVEPISNFDLIPAGKYTAMIVASTLKPNRAGTGSYLELTFKICEGAYKGRQLWARLNLDHPNELVVKIAQAELAAICRAVGVLTPRDSVELHNRPLTIRVGCKKRKDTDEMVNTIDGYERNGQAQQQNVPPWRRP